jgi:hypothetical protein
MLINLGQVGAIRIATTPPVNVKMFWYDDNIGQKLIKYYNPGSLAWEPVVGAGSAVLQNDLNVVGVTVGGVTSGTSWPSGTPIETVLRDILTNVVPPNYIAPSATLAISPSTLNYEVGVAASITLTPTFNQNDAGAANAYSLMKNMSEIATVLAPYLDNFTITLGQFSYQAQISYNEGPTKNNNAVPPAPDPTGKILAGSVMTNIRTVNGVYPYFFGVSDVPDVLGSDIYSGNVGKGIVRTKVVIQAPTTLVLGSGFGTGNKFLWFATPDTYNRTYTKWFRTALDQGNIGGLSDLFGAVQSVNVSSTGLATNWSNIPYRLHVSNYATIAGTATEIRP